MKVKITQQKQQIPRMGPGGILKEFLGGYVPLGPWNP